MYQLLSNWWPHLVFLFGVAISLIASAHAVLHKRDTRAAIAWSGIIWLSPIVGTLLYIVFGVNRIERRAQTLRGKQPRITVSRSVVVFTPQELREHLGEGADHVYPLARLVTEVTGWPVLSGNDVRPLANGCEAYPAMLAAIDSAQHSLTFTTYIFDNDASGRMFVDAFRRAVERGVQVRVIVDDVGRRYSWNSILGPLAEAGVRVAQFLPTHWPWHFRYANLRSHRKIMVIDGTVGFTGGMNIRHGNTLEASCTHPIQDLHFRVVGPVVGQMQETFASDWAFCTGELLSGERWFPKLSPAGTMLARGIQDGPDEDAEKLRMTYLGAIAEAQHSITIATPYFIPEDALLTSLSVAAMCGVEVDIILPRKNNLRLVEWAMTPLVREVLRSGARVWLSEPPFDHSKLMVVDGIWSLIGSANWDQRSLRLNFEFCLEVYDRGFAEQMHHLARLKMHSGRQFTAAEIDARSFPVKLRNGLARLASPYL